ncbi:MAG: polymer-forming cytoskeletal protein [Tannerellaceae bacterium]|jgi:cytoskeletal protein CcmA (bactofilin family)|nr:polymer-forming cytoskeletal protein [Tannerellaceae bacterium]
MFDKTRIKREMQPEAVTGLSILSNTVVVTGGISLEEDLRIDGRVKGDISCKGKIVIGADGFVHGNIQSTSLELRGRMSGDIACGSVCLRAGSSFEGNITAGTVEIEAGACFSGNCKTESKREENSKQ